MKYQFNVGDFVYYTGFRNLGGIKSGVIVDRSTFTASYTIKDSYGAKFNGISESNMSKNLSTARKRILKAIEQEKSNALSSIKNANNRLTRMDELRQEVEKIIV